jgi:hypothetical protein
MAPALDWLRILNPLNAAWTEPGGALWALAPILLLLAPLLVTAVIITFLRYWVFFIEWIRRFLDMLIKIIELIPGM